VNRGFKGIYHFHLQGRKSTAGKRTALETEGERKTMRENYRGGGLTG
jgi:hypothetical protein